MGMASFRTPALRHVVSGAAPYLRATQRRWAQVHDVRFLATQQSDWIIEKYKEKLAKKAQEEGLRDINELKEVYKDKIQHLKKKASIPIPLDPLPAAQTTTTQSSPFPPAPPPPQVPTQQIPPSSPGIKTLSSYLDLERRRLLELFGKGDPAFKVEDLVEEAEKII